ncbi:MAG: hypothetical protein WAM42_13160 [Candidatus Nitrosopolaris sp.]
MQILDDNKHASVTPVKDVKATTSDNVNSIGLDIHYHPVEKFLLHLKYLRRKGRHSYIP